MNQQQPIDETPVGPDTGGSPVVSELDEQRRVVPVDLTDPDYAGPWDSRQDVPALDAHRRAVALDDMTKRRDAARALAREYRGQVDAAIAELHQAHGRLTAAETTAIRWAARVKLARDAQQQPGTGDRR